MAERGFCKNCGTPLTYAFDGPGGQLAINSLDDRKRCRQQAIGMESKAHGSGHSCTAGPDSE